MRLAIDIWRNGSLTRSTCVAGDMDHGKAGIAFMCPALGICHELCSIRPELDVCYNRSSEGLRNDLDRARHPYNVTCDPGLALTQCRMRMSRSSVNFFAAVILKSDVGVPGPLKDLDTDDLRAV
jgi:hypothetical protein